MVGTGLGARRGVLFKNAMALETAARIQAVVAMRSPRPACRTATLGDIIAEFAVFGLGATVAGLTLGAEYIGDYFAAVALGIVFQYLAIAPMRGLSLRKGLIVAAKADVASLTAFEIGLHPGGESAVTVASDAPLSAEAVAAALDEAGDYRLAG